VRCAQELGKKVEEFKQAEAKLLLQNDANLKTLQDKLVCQSPLNRVPTSSAMVQLHAGNIYVNTMAWGRGGGVGAGFRHQDANMDLSKQLQIQLNEREAKEKHLAEELATANEKVRESEAGLMALKEANDVAQCENQAHTEQLKQLTSEMEKLQKEVPPAHACDSATKSSRAHHVPSCPRVVRFVRYARGLYLIGTGVRAQSNTVKNESQTAFSKVGVECRQFSHVR
jgi:hypothetical protein